LTVYEESMRVKRHILGTISSPLILVVLTLTLISASLSLAVRTDDEDAHHGLRSATVERLRSSSLPKEAVVLLISTLPIFELRGGLPIAVNMYAMPWWKGYIICVVGNLIPIMPFLLFLGPLSRQLGRVSPLGRGLDWLFLRTRRRSGIVEKYQALGLVLFVAIPLPVTGAWTGAIAAFLFGIPVTRAFPMITLGVLIAGAIVTTLCLLGIWGAIIAGIGLGGLVIWSTLVPTWRR
jgi:uncharacterized membrane protein